MTATLEQRTLERLVEAALAHVPFDGWGPEAFHAAVRDSGVEPELARALCPRGAVDLAVSFHRMGDRALARRLRDDPAPGLRHSERVARAILMRLELAEPHREAVRRAAALHALPTHAAEGAALIWETADTIWTALGDDSRDLAWWTKRATLATVFSASLLYWLGDESDGRADTAAFVARRIDDVMRIEKLKARMRAAPGLGRLGATLAGLVPPLPARSELAAGLPGTLVDDGREDQPA